MDAPETITEAVTFLEAEGYRDELVLRREGLTCAAVEGAHPFEHAVVDHTFRFEGPSDPADEAIVLGISLPDWNRKGVLVSAFGPSAEPEEAELLIALTRSRSG
jgi:hypothetical protein